MIIRLCRLQQVIYYRTWALCTPTHVIACLKLPWSSYCPRTTDDLPAHCEELNMQETRLKCTPSLRGWLEVFLRVWLDSSHYSSRTDLTKVVMLFVKREWSRISLTSFSYPLLLRDPRTVICLRNCISIRVLGLLHLVKLILILSMRYFCFIWSCFTTVVEVVDNSFIGKLFVRLDYHMVYQVWLLESWRVWILGLGKFVKGKRNVGLFFFEDIRLCFHCSDLRGKFIFCYYWNDIHIVVPWKNPINELVVLIQGIWISWSSLC